MPIDDRPSGLWLVRLLAFSAIVFFLGLPASGATTRDLTGVWEGAIVTRPAVLELDVRLEVEEGEDGPVLTLYLPPRGPGPRPATEVSWVDGELAFSIAEEDETSRFTGSLSEDGERIDGKVTEASGSYDFFLVRADGEAEPTPELIDLGADVGRLADEFRAAEGEPRLVIVVSPSCLICKVGVRLVDRYVMERTDDPLAVFVVWEGILDHDDREAAGQAAALLTDPRVRHYWSAERAAGTAFRRHFEGSEDPVWDVFMLFDPEASWGDAPPAPDFYMHNNGALPNALRLNGERLQTELETLRPPEGVLSLFGLDCQCEDGETEDDHIE